MYHQIWTYNNTGHVLTKLFRFRIKIRLKFQNEYFLGYFPLFVQENLIFASIDIVNVVSDLKWIRLKYMLETINYNKVDPVFLVGLNFHNGSNYKTYIFFHKKSFNFREVLFGVHIWLNINGQSLNNYSIVGFKKSPQ